MPQSLRFTNALTVERSTEVGEPWRITTTVRFVTEEDLQPGQPVYVDGPGRITGLADANSDPIGYLLEIRTQDVSPWGRRTMAVARLYNSVPVLLAEQGERRQDLKSDDPLE